MRINIAAATAFGAAVVAAQNLPLRNGFPMPNAKAIAKIEKNAGGSLPNGKLPTTLTDEATSTFQLLAHQEIFETVYFSSLLQNITNNVPGYKSKDRKYLMRTFRRIRAQEELHAIGINAILENAGKPTVEGCDYVYPVKTLDSAITLATVFTDVVLGVLPAVQELFASEGGDETGLIPLVGSILAQEGEQVGYFRSTQGKVPSAAPFLTGAAGPFAYSALKMFIVPGSCKGAIPDVPFFPPITVNTPPKAQNSVVSYTVEGTVDDSMSLAYISGQHSPFVVPITNVVKKGKMSTFKAKFPFESGFSKGLTIAAVIKGDSSPASVAEVAAATKYGPGLIEVG